MSSNSAEFMDEQIIELINEKEKQITQELYRKNIVLQFKTGVVMLDGTAIEFEKRSLFNGRIKMVLPKSFELMDSETASIKYPFEKRPNPIFTDDTITKNILFNYIDSELNEDEMAEFTDSMKVALEKMQPGAIWFEDGVEKIDGKKIGYFQLVTQALDANVFNFMFFAELDGKVLMCTINCLEEDMENWKLIAGEMMRSFEVCLEA